MFQDHRAYWKFSQSVRNSDRYALSPDSQKFIKSFKLGVHGRAATLKEGTLLFRAVRDYVEELDEENGSVLITGASEERLLPKKKFAFEGRVNPNGTIVLYLASSIETAVSEVRPWIGETISVAHFRILKDLKIADLSKGHNKNLFSRLTIEELMDNSKISLEKSDACTWDDIDSAFSRPTTRTDTGAEYVPTQILSEIVKSEGFDGIFYKSSFGGERGYNIALFELTHAEAIRCNAFSIDNLIVEFSQAGNAWSKRKESSIS